MKPTELLHLNQRQPSNAYLVNGLRKAVYTRREQGYPGTTPIPKRVLQYWFKKKIYFGEFEKFF